MASIEEEINQAAFHNEYLKAHVNILFTASWLSYKTGPIFRKHNLTIQQYNVLRILRGATPHPISIKELMARLIDKTSNASRLVDKLERKKYVTRTNSEKDKRRVDVIITPAGLQAVNMASVDVELKIDELFSVLEKEQAGQISSLLDTLRS